MLILKDTASKIKAKWRGWWFLYLAGYENRRSIKVFFSFSTATTFILLNNLWQRDLAQSFKFSGVLGNVRGVLVAVITWALQRTSNSWGGKRAWQGRAYSGKQWVFSPLPCLTCPLRISRLFALVSVRYSWITVCALLQGDISVLFPCCCSTQSWVVVVIIIIIIFASIGLVFLRLPNISVRQ